jgi:hypothetical protein
VVWDDWGGFYDDILPWNCDATGFCSGYPNTTAREYVYGFRVPLLVVGAYVNQVTLQGGYISGPCPSGNCQGQEKPPYVHDFGSSKCPGPYNLSDSSTSTRRRVRSLPLRGTKYDTGVFLNPTAYFPNYPADPDDDAIDPQ